MTQKVMTKIAVLEDERLKLLETVDQMQNDNQRVCVMFRLPYMYMYVVLCSSYIPTMYIYKCMYI